MDSNFFSDMKPMFPQDSTWEHEEELVFDEDENISLPSDYELEDDEIDLNDEDIDQFLTEDLEDLENLENIKNIKNIEPEESREPEKEEEEEARPSILNKPIPQVTPIVPIGIETKQKGKQTLARKKKKPSQSPDDIYNTMLMKKREDLKMLLSDLNAIETEEKNHEAFEATKKSLALTSEGTSEKLYKRVILLEKENKRKDIKLEEFKGIFTRLNRLNKNKDESIISLTQDLGFCKDRINRMTYELNIKAIENNSSSAVSKEHYEKTKLHIENVKALEKQNIADGSVNKIPVDLYHRVMSLENELQDRERIIQENSKEITTLKQQLKKNELGFLKLRTSYESKSNYKLESQKVIDDNKISELNNLLQETRDENKCLLEIQRQKTKAIEDLSAEVMKRGHSQDYQEQLKREIRTKDKDIADLLEENTKLLKILEAKEKALFDLQNGNTGIPFNVWERERLLMKAELKQAQENKGKMDLQNKKLNDHIRKLQERFDFLVSSNALGVSPAKFRRNNQAKPFSTPQPPKRPSHFIDLNATTEIIDTESVPSKVYEQLENNLRRLASELKLKETTLFEKDEAIELLEKKIEVLSHAKSSEIRKYKKLEGDTKDQIAQMQEKVDFLEEETREREQILRLEIYKLKNKLNKEES